MTTITITVPGPPIARPRQRVGVRAGHAVTYTPTSHPVHTYRAAIQLAWRAATDAAPATGPVALWIEAVFPRPKSRTKKRGPNESYEHTIKPDADNIYKAAADALNGLAYVDDSQVCLATVKKRVAAADEQARTEIRVYT